MIRPLLLDVNNTDYTAAALKAFNVYLYMNIPIIFVQFILGSCN